MYSGAVIGQRIQSSGFSSVPRSPLALPTSAAAAAAAAATTTTTSATATTSPDSKQQPNLIQQQWSTILPGVNGKVTAECLLNACRAILIGTTLIAIGAAMATVGYYANELSLEEQTTGNLTVKVKNPTRGFHLNNLSYVGPIVMGFGGFILVAACVMTFEARDNASKIVPARYLNKLHETTVGVTDGGQINTSLFTTNGAHIEWDGNRLSPKLNLFQQIHPPSFQPPLPVSSVGHCEPRTSEGSWKSSTGSRAGNLSKTLRQERSALTADFVRFSQSLSHKCVDRKRAPEVHGLNNSFAINRSPSAPDFLPELLVDPFYAPHISYNNPLAHANWSREPADVIRCRLLKAIHNNNLSFLPRQAVSVDNPHIKQCPLQARGTMASSDAGNANAVPKSESETSMTMDLHFPDGSITLRVKDESKQGDSNSSNSPNAQERKDTAKRPPLLRQCRVEHADSELEFNNPG